MSFYVWETRKENATEGNGMKLCDECKEPFDWDDSVIHVEEKDEIYHRECVNVFPIAYGVMISDNWIGETECENGVSAFEILPEGKYREDEHQ